MLSVLVLSPSSAKSQCDATTVGEAKYSWIKIKSGIDVFSETKDALWDIGFTRGHNYNSGDLDLMSIASNIYGQNYGGVLLWESHGGLVGGEYCALIEEKASKTEADARIVQLVPATYADGDLIYYLYGSSHYVALTEQGLSNVFAGCGSNAIALIASCNSNVSGDWGLKLVSAIATV